jgi:hypothetical protein
MDEEACLFFLRRDALLLAKASTNDVDVALSCPF